VANNQQRFMFVVLTALSAWPTGATAQAAHFDASPTSGTAPLTVRFCASVGIAIDFGDGTSSAMGMPPSGTCPVGEVYSTHTYVAPGTFNLRGLPCPGSLNTNCGEVSQKASAVVITVTAAQ
jgi:hypothetical protein